MSDPGAYRERTALAWQRTALSILAGSAVMARITWTTLGTVATVLLGTSALLTAWVLVESRTRHGTDPRLRPPDPQRGGRAALGISLASALLASTELVAVLTR